MQIQTVIDHTTVYQVTLADSTILWVPKDPLNEDYVRVQAWLAAGGVITD